MTRIQVIERRFRSAVANVYGLEADEASDDDIARLSAPYKP